MITAIDSSVLLDVAVNDPVHGQRSANAIRVARQQGRMIISEFVVAELYPVCGQQTSQFLTALGLDFVSSDYDSALDAGNLFARYLQRGGKRGRIVADFLIGTHAMRHGNRLLTRDEGFERDYFDNLVLWYP